MRRKRYPNYAVRVTVLALLVLLALVIGAARGWDVLFPNDYSSTVQTR